MFCFKHKTADEVVISDWSSDVCSSDLGELRLGDRVVGEAAGAKLARLRPCGRLVERAPREAKRRRADRRTEDVERRHRRRHAAPARPQQRVAGELHRSEEHTSELQSLMRISYAVFCLKKKNKTSINTYNDR